MRSRKQKQQAARAQAIPRTPKAAATTTAAARKLSAKPLADYAGRPGNVDLSAVATRRTIRGLTT